MTLFEVIVHKRGRSFGCAFDKKTEADKFAQACKSLGFEVDPYPEFGVYTAETALADTLSYFNGDN